MSSIELMEAVRTGTADAVQQAINGGADVNQQDGNGWTPLCWAAGRGELAILRLLLEHGADAGLTGRDQRSPSMIAIAAGHADAGRLLRDAVAARAGQPAATPRRYCKAYRVEDLRRFTGWPASAPVGDAEIVYLHDSLRVTRSMWADDQIVFEASSPEWQQFCATQLAFHVPDDLDLMGRG